MADILHLVSIDSTPDKVFGALSERRGLAGWWTEDVAAEPKVGTVAMFRFGEHGGCDMEIVALEPDRLVRWHCVAHLSGDEWIGTELTFDLRAEKGATVVRFSHRGWPEAGDFFRFCSTRWALYLVSLKNLVETGKGNPWPRDIET
jgi:uncharacterized protein YndB with AHSA1/START domain